MQTAPALAPEGAQSDDSLLEGLLQLAVAGQTDAQRFQQIGDEVFTRLLDTYGVQTGVRALR